MKLSMGTEMAVRGILVLAAREDSRPVSLKEVCRLRDLSRDNMTRLFALLTRARLVMAVRGKNGGYRLARPASEITLLDVIEAVEGPLALNLCQQDPAQCDRPNCPMKEVWDGLQEEVRAALSENTLEDFACILP